MRKDNVNAVITIPHKIKDKKVCGFFEARNKIVKTITLAEFDKYGKDKKLLKNLIKDFDFFVASAPLMPGLLQLSEKFWGLLVRCRRHNLEFCLLTRKMK